MLFYVDNQPIQEEANASKIRSNFEMGNRVEDSTLKSVSDTYVKGIFFISYVS